MESPFYWEKGQVYSTMAIRKLADGRWQVQVDVGLRLDGSRDRRSKICRTERQAKKAEAELMARRIVNGGSSGRMLLEDFVEEYWLPEKKPLCTWDTYRAYESHLRNHILPALGKMNLCDIKHSHIQRMISGCATEKVAKNARSTLRNVLQMALDYGAIQSNPASSRGFRYPARIQKMHTLHGEWLTDFRQHREVIEAARGTRAFAILVLGLCFGLRKGEILGLDWEQVDFEAGCIHIVQTYVRQEKGSAVKAPKTPGSVRDIPMTAYARELLASILPERATGPVVRSAQGRMSPSGAAKALSRFTASHDVPAVTILSLRHSFATSAIRAGINVVSVSKWLGHSSVATTLNRYVKPLQQDLKADVADVVDRLYKAA